jgi:glycosyltransferase involved in cell wall biosynthesis
MEANDMVPGQRQMLPATLRADCFIALNEKIIEELQNVGVPVERMTVIPNGVNVNSANTKSDYGIKAEVTLVFVGRLHPQKDLNVLLAAFKQVVRRRPNTRWRLWLLGEGTLRLQLEQMTKEMGFNEEVTFFGQVSDVSTYFNKTDIFVLPSRAEGMSNALMEAMAHGLPCIASRISGNEKLIQHNVNGLLVNCGDSIELANAIITLAGDESLRKNLGKAAYETVRDEYSMDYVARRYISLYHSLVNR